MGTKHTIDSCVIDIKREELEKLVKDLALKDAKNLGCADYIVAQVASDGYGGYKVLLVKSILKV